MSVTKHVFEHYGKPDPKCHFCQMDEERKRSGETPFEQLQRVKREAILGG